MMPNYLCLTGLRLNIVTICFVFYNFINRRQYFFDDVSIPDNFLREIVP